MEKAYLKALTIILILVLTMNLASAITINSVDADDFAPGQEGTIRIEVKNILSDDADNIFIRLVFTNLPFIPIGTSEQFVEEIEEDEEEDFHFRIKASTNILAGDYEIPYFLHYEVNGKEVDREGTIGIKVRANPDLVFTIDADNAVKGKQGQLSLKIVNKGFYDARFVSLKLIPTGFTLLSDDEIYLGSVDSDDFETATFDVIFNSLNADFTAILEYKDFDNEVVIKSINIPIKVYSEEKAIELGIITPDRTLDYVISVIVLIILFIIWRALKKRRRLKRSMGNRRD